MKHRQVELAEARLATILRAEELVLTAIQLREGSLSAAQQHPAVRAIGAMRVSLRAELGKACETFGDQPEDQDQ